MSTVRWGYILCVISNLLTPSPSTISGPNQPSEEILKIIGSLCNMLISIKNVIRGLETLISCQLQIKPWFLCEDDTLRPPLMYHMTEIPFWNFWAKGRRREYPYSKLWVHHDSSMNLALGIKNGHSWFHYLNYHIRDNYINNIII